MFFVWEYNFGWRHFHLWIWLYKVFSIPTEIQLAVALNYEGGLKFKNSLQAFPTTLLRCLLWNFHYMKWNTKLVKIYVNRMNINQLIQEFKIKMITLLPVLSFPHNRRICQSNLTEKKIYSSMQHKMQWWCRWGQMSETHDTSWNSATSKQRNAKSPFSFAPPHFGQSVTRILSSWKFCMPTRYKCTISICICHLQKGLFTFLCNFRSFCQGRMILEATLKLCVPPVAFAIFCEGWKSWLCFTFI